MENDFPSLKKLNYFFRNHKETDEQQNIQTSTKSINDSEEKDLHDSRLDYINLVNYWYHINTSKRDNLLFQTTEITLSDQNPISPKHSRRSIKEKIQLKNLNDNFLEIKNSLNEVCHQLKIQKELDNPKKNFSKYFLLAQCDSNLNKARKEKKMQKFFYKIFEKLPFDSEKQLNNKFCEKIKSKSILTDNEILGSKRSNNFEYVNKDHNISELDQELSERKFREYTDQNFKEYSNKYKITENFIKTRTYNLNHDNFIKSSSQVLENCRESQDLLFTQKKPTTEWKNFHSRNFKPNSFQYDKFIEPAFVIKESTKKIQSLNDLSKVISSKEYLISPQKYPLKLSAKHDRNIIKESTIKEFISSIPHKLKSTHSDIIKSKYISQEGSLIQEKNRVSKPYTINKSCENEDFNNQKSVNEGLSIQKKDKESRQYYVNESLKNEKFYDKKSSKNSILYHKYSSHSDEIKKPNPNILESKTNKMKQIETEKKKNAKIDSFSEKNRNNMMRSGSLINKVNTNVFRKLNTQDYLEESSFSQELGTDIHDLKKKLLNEQNYKTSVENSSKNISNHEQTPVLHEEYSKKFSKDLNLSKNSDDFENNTRVRIKKKANPIYKKTGFSVPKIAKNQFIGVNRTDFDTPATKKEDTSSKINNNIENHIKPDIQKKIIIPKSKSRRIIVIKKWIQ